MSRNGRLDFGRDSNAAAWRVTASTVAPGRMRATSGTPNDPSVRPSVRTSLVIHTNVFADGNLKPGSRTPTTVRGEPAMK